MMDAILESVIGDNNANNNKVASREEVFQRAMTLMSNRCTSAREEDDDLLFSNREPPFGVHIPQYFYLNQRKPVPMAPLKAWRGYKGNVYFEPMSIKNILQPDGDNVYGSLPGTAMSRHKSASRAPTRATTAGMSKKSYRLVNSSPQIFIMDKQAVARSDNYDIEQDLRFIDGIEATGSLAVRPPSSYMIREDLFCQRPPAKQKKERLLYKRERIRRGSNYHNTNNRNVPNNSNNNKNMNQNDYHSSRKSCTSGGSRKSSLASSKISTQKQANGKSKAMSNQDLMISGDKFALPMVMSPILRNSNKFSFTDQRRRPMAESPDAYKGYLEGPDPDVLKDYAMMEVPSLDRVHVSLERMDITDENYEKIVSCDDQESYTESVTPFVDISFKKAAVKSC